MFGARAAPVMRPAAGGGGAYVQALALSFDGSNDYATFGAVAPMAGAPNDASTDRLISLWIKTSASGGTFIGKGTESAGQYQWLLYLSSGAVRGLVGDNFFGSGGSIANGAWHHVAFGVHTVSAVRTAQMWIDGVSGGSTTAGSRTVTSDWLLGGLRNNNNTDVTDNCACRINNLTMWSGAQGVINIANLVASLRATGKPTDPNLDAQAAYLKLWAKTGDGDTYPTLTDSVAGNNGTCTNMAGSGNIVSDVV
jgi:hypothetical protein